MYLNAQHCFLLDGKTILPINSNHQLFISLKKLNHIQNKNCLYCQRKFRSHQYLINEKFQSMNNNKYEQINEGENLCSCSCHSISENKYRKISKQNTCKYHQSNNDETYVINHIIPSINLTIDSTSMNKNQTNKFSSPITIIIKPLISSENNLSFNEKLSLKKRKNSSISLDNPTKRMLNCQSDQTTMNHRLLTFKDLTRTIPTPINSNQMNSSNILNSRTLLDIYRNKN